MRVTLPTIPGKIGESRSVYDMDNQKVLDYFLLDSVEAPIREISTSVLAAKIMEMALRPGNNFDEGIKVSFFEERDLSWWAFEGVKSVQAGEPEYAERITPRHLENHYPRRTWTEFHTALPDVEDAFTVTDELDELRLDYLVWDFIEHPNSIFGSAAARDVWPEEIPEELFRTVFVPRLELETSVGLTDAFDKDALVRFVASRDGKHAFAIGIKDQTFRYFRTTFHSAPKSFGPRTNAPSQQVIRELKNWTKPALSDADATTEDD